MQHGERSHDIHHDSARFWRRLLDAALGMALLAVAGGLPYLLSDDIALSRVALGLFAAAMLGYSLAMRVVLRRGVRAEMQRRRHAFFLAGAAIAPVFVYGVHRDGGLHSPTILALLPPAALTAAAFPWRDARWHLLPLAAGYGLLAATTDDVEPWRVAWGFGIGLAVVVPVMMIRRGTLEYTSDQERSTSLLRVELALDALTGCLNHRAFHECLSEFRGGNRSSDHVCVAVLDVDHFKAINDTHGHLRGDDVLREVGEVLRATIRRGDIAGRIGGEEFALLLPDTELDEARQLAERVRIAVRDLRPSGLLVTISCGVAQHEPGTSLTAALDLADSRLYHAKAGGRDQVVG